MDHPNSNQFIAIERGQRNDLPEIQKLFIGTIQSVCSQDYNEKQINVWTSSVKNTQYWNRIFLDQIVFIAKKKKKIVGFSSLAQMNFIDLLYVHENYQGQGIAMKLYHEMESIALQNNQIRIQANVSKTAKPFFEKVGFFVTKEQVVMRENIELINFSMEKKLNNKS